MKLSIKRVSRTFTSEQYNMFCDSVSGLVGSMDVHICSKNIIVRLILFHDIDKIYEVSSIKEYICIFLEELAEEKEIILDIITGKGIGIFSNKTDCMLPSE
ncbi:hypothetical protein FDB37_15790 [Clostridium botulinum]|uniref:hypothetical protein n=1 Tax=Clostridium botulinum TaxID=1491 RepID=UPI0013F00A9B|nr:hypothetical protein [Clostridium botulinum]MBN1050348.1 hypothetical protein [Clostridium botulinum]NFO35028.1 hypothetical protein [Clostridium botulinum]